MRIALFSAHFAPEFTGGTEQVALAQALALQEQGHQVRVITGTDEPHREEDIVRREVHGLKVSVLPRRDDESMDLVQSWPRLLETLEAEVCAVDLFIVHGQSTLGSGLVRFLSPLAPVILYLHDQHVSCPRSFRRTPVEGVTCPSREDLRQDGHRSCAQCLGGEQTGLGPSALSLALAARQRTFQREIEAAARVVVPSRTHLVRLSEFVDFGPGQVRILGPGLCLPLVKPSRRKARWSGKGPLRILHAGRRSVEKGSLDLATALGRMGGGQVELVCMGTSEPGLDLAMQRAAGGCSIEWHGAYDAGQLAQVASTCHVAAFPSRLAESYSLCIDEALFLGLPVWASNAEAALERHGRLGLHSLPSADPGAWAAAIAEWVADPRATTRLMNDIPQSLPTSYASAQALGRWGQELVRQFRERTLSTAGEYRRPA